MQRIAIFGGSFNPVTKGHLAVAQYAITELALDALFFVPAYQNPFKAARALAPAHHRIAMLQNVLAAKMMISTFEVDRQGPSYTIETVKYFRRKYPQAQLVLLIGSDNLAKLPKWRAISEICNLCQIVVFRRTVKINKTNLKRFGAQLLDNPLHPAASSRFLQGYFEDVALVNRTYIGQHRLYFETILQRTLSQRRYLHSCHARTYAIQLAQSLSYDPDVAGFSALVHDLAKEVPNDQARALIQNYAPQGRQLVPDYQLHQELGYWILKREFQIDETICHSIRVHTSLALDLTLLDKIVFMADKLCVGRKWPGIQKLRHLSFTNFDAAFAKVVIQTRDFNLAKGIELTLDQAAIYIKWSKMSET